MLNYFIDFQWLFDWFSDNFAVMFCADYIASFIHHGIIVGLWCEYQDKKSDKSKINTAQIPPLHSMLAGLLSGI